MIGFGKFLAQLRDKRDLIPVSLAPYTDLVVHPHAQSSDRTDRHFPIHRNQPRHLAAAGRGGAYETDSDPSQNGSNFRHLI